MPIKFRGIDCANKSLAYTHCDVYTVAEVELNMQRVVFQFLAKWNCPWYIYSCVVHQRDWHGAFDAYLFTVFDAMDGNSVILKTERNAVLAERLMADIGTMIRDLTLVVIHRIHILDCGVVDMIPGRKLSTVGKIERTKLLRNTLTRIGGGARYTVIEDQPTFNFKSSTVRDQAIMFYADGEVGTIKASLKNTLSFAPHLTREHFSHMKSYDGNKEHTKQNMLYFLAMTGNLHLLEGISKSNYPDLADSFMEILALCVSMGILR